VTAIYSPKCYLCCKVISPYADILRRGFFSPSLLPSSPFPPFPFLLPFRSTPLSSPSPPLTCPSSPLPFPSPPFLPLSFLPLPFLTCSLSPYLSFPYLSIPSPLLEVGPPKNPARGLEDRCKLPSGVWKPKSILVHFSYKISSLWWQPFS